MTKFEKYKVKVDTYAPGLRPKYNPGDLAKLKSLYSDFENRMDGIEKDWEELGVEKIVITIVKKGGLADDGEI